MRKKSNGEGRVTNAAKAALALPSPPPIKNSDDGQNHDAAKAIFGLPSSLSPNDKSQSSLDDESTLGMPLSFPPSGEGQPQRAQKAGTCVPSPPPIKNSDDGQLRLADKATRLVPSSLPESGEGLASHADKATRGLPSPPPDIELIIAGIRTAHRQRCFAMEQRKRADLSLGAFLRTMLGWSKTLPEAERTKVAKRAAALVALGEAEARGKEVDTDETAYVEWRDIIAASLAARAPFDAIEKRAVKQMGKLAKTLPVYAWAEAVRGFGDVSLAVIAAEAGDLANYATHSKLWKRMGVAVMGDVRQGGLAKNASKDDWIAHGYNRQRRSRLWNIGDTLIKAQVRKKLDDDGEDQGERVGIGAYGAVYIARKQYELAREPDMQPIKAHRRAQRYMEKRLLRNLWRAWRDERKALIALPETAASDMPSAQPYEQQAMGLVPEAANPELLAVHTHEDAATLPVPSVASEGVPHPHRDERKAIQVPPDKATRPVPSAHIHEGEAAHDVFEKADSSMLPLHRAA